MIVLRLFFLFYVLLTGIQSGQTADQPAPESWEGIVLSVWDGNTFDISKNGEIHKVLLAYVGAPARGQPSAKEARVALKNLIYGKNVKLTIIRKDMIGRLIAQIHLNNQDINAEMVKIGYAWVYRKFTQDKTLIGLENQARANKIGLWSVENPVEPWVFRQQQRELKQNQAGNNQAIADKTNQSGSSASIPAASVDGAQTKAATK